MIQVGRNFDSVRCRGYVCATHSCYCPHVGPLGKQIILDLDSFLNLKEIISKMINREKITLSLPPFCLLRVEPGAWTPGSSRGKLDDFCFRYNLGDFWYALSLNWDTNGLEYISTIEATNHSFHII
jgi:hypothetical protein